CRTWETVAVIHEPDKSLNWIPALAFHPTLPLLVTAGSEQSDKKVTSLIHFYELDYEVLLAGPLESNSVSYTSAKVVLVGDSGVGKSGLALRMATEKFEATESTHGRHVWLFESCEVALADGRKQARETLLWDLAGQPGYRLVH